MTVRLKSLLQSNRALLLLGVGVSLYLWQLRGTIIDDAFISLQYAYNLGHSFHWGLISDQVSNSATSPLNVILSALAGLALPDMPSAAIVLAAGESILLCALLLDLSKRLFGARFFGVVAFLGLMANPLLMSTLGLESLLYVLLMVAALWFFLRLRSTDLAITLGLLTLTRPDGILLCLVLLWVFPFKRTQALEPLGRWERLRVRLGPRLTFLATFLLTLLPWYLFSWFFLGSFVPDTFFLKVVQPWGGWSFANSIPVYWSRYPAETFFSFWLIPLGLLLWLGRNPGATAIARILILFGVLYFAAYSIMQVSPFHWYLAPLAAITVLVGTLGVASLLNRFERRAFVRFGAYVLVPACMLGMLVSFWNARTLALAEAPIHTNWATPEQYREIGLWLQAHVDRAQKIKMNGEVGTVAYYSQRQLYDAFGCRRDVSAALHRFDQSGAVVASALQVNFHWLSPGASCGPYSYELDGFTYTPTQVSDPARIVMQWDISSQWAKGGKVYLLRPPSGPAPQLDPRAPLVIHEFGPTSARVGQSFNQQPDGASAFWFKTENAVPGLQLIIDGRMIPMDYGSAELVAAEIFAKDLGSPHTIEMYLFDPVTRRTSNPVQFVWESASP